MASNQTIEFIGKTFNIALMKITNLKLHNFRNIEQASLTLKGQAIVVLYGENGAGKTSVLEALSLLTPGRGLHRLKMDSHTQHGFKEWVIHAQLENDQPQQIGMHFKGSKRHIKLNGEKNKTQGDLSTLGNILWFTPKMDRLFMDSASARREFLDRLVFGQQPQHAGNLNRLKHHLKNRLKLLKDHAPTDWIDIEEEQAAQYAVKVAQARTDYLTNLHQHLTAVHLELEGSFEKRDDKSPQALQQKWADTRQRDLKAGATLHGPQRSNLTGQLTELDIPLAQCSTGQHKKAILEILIANARLTAATTHNPPIILLDEVAGHLDQKTKNYFLTEVTNLGCQVWLTGTEKETFANLTDAQFFHVQQGQVQAG